MPYYHLHTADHETHALFAAQVLHWPYDLLARHIWVSDDTSSNRDQLLDHQKRFIAALHPGSLLNPTHRLAFDLRYAHRPGDEYLECALIAKLAAPTAEEAREAATALWDDLQLLMPIGYELKAAEDEATYRRLTGADIIEETDNPARWAEIRRPVEYLLWSDEATPHRYVPIVQDLAWQPAGWDAVWASLVRAQSPALLSVSLTPAYLTVQEELTLAHICRELEDLAKNANSSVAFFADRYLAMYRDYMVRFSVPFQMRVTVVGPRALKLVVRGALASATWPTDSDGPGVSNEFLSPEFALPANDDEFQAVRRNLIWLEQADWAPDPFRGALLYFDRLRYLVDESGALCAFRLPLFPPDAIAGFRVGAEIHPDD